MSAITFQVPQKHTKSSIGVQTISENIILILKSCSVVSFYMYVTQFYIRYLQSYLNIAFLNFFSQISLAGGVGNEK